MKKTCLIFSFLFVFSICISGQKTGETKVLKPTKFKQEVTVIVENKSRVYNALNSEKNSLVFVQGPGKLRLLTRAQFAEGQKRTIGYEIIYSMNGGETQSLKVKSIERSALAKFQDNSLGTPGQLHQFEIIIPRGDNTIEFKLAENSNPVIVRFLYNAIKEKKKEWISYTPSQSAEIVDLISNESIVSYHRFSGEKPLKIELTGPTQLRVFTRLEFHHQMRGTVQCRLQVVNNGKVINTYLMNNKRSDVSAYKIPGELVPGKANEFVIDVPAGNQTYEIIPLDKDKKTILGRLMILKKDVRNSTQ
jgi:hypothetical protein